MGERGFAASAAMQYDADLEHVLIDFFDQNKLQLFDFERFLFGQVIPQVRSKGRTAAAETAAAAGLRTALLWFISVAVLYNSR